MSTALTRYCVKFESIAHRGERMRARFNRTHARFFKGIAPRLSIRAEADSDGMTNSSASLCQRMVIGAGWMILWRLAVRIASFLSDCGWIVPIRGNEMAELLRYLNAVLLVAAAVWYQRLGERRASQVFFARCRVARNHFADRGIFVGDRRSRFAPLAAEFLDGVRLGHFMDTQSHLAAPTARPSATGFALSRPAAALDRLTSDPVG